MNFQSLHKDLIARRPHHERVQYEKIYLSKEKIVQLKKNIEIHTMPRLVMEINKFLHRNNYSKNKAFDLVIDVVTCMRLSEKKIHMN